ncbi:hypothetical protein [Mycobacterium arosiense]|uniref:Uncharacterized protein n=1 Tax=Mycobacterium arosiense ATCC BAA-1401 = DSM 45069 TaxID=1265311 RepID=A0A1W9ZDI1_MYCAI|nr:hypothetical protein [Mycobacterium arosiense]ORA12730.1 hypothetical protein BST14_16380 [Mycobacterium arosiense ATCC BAA-1401 = DSM 45069]
MWPPTDEQIQAMPPQERRDLIRRLERPVSERIDPATRRARVRVMVAGSLALIPWMVYLWATLPVRHLVTNWPFTWVGFDSLLIALVAATAYLGARRRIVLTAFATAVMLICDAWFDVTTAGPHDVSVSVVTAVCAEVPLAGLLILGTVRLMRTMASRLCLLTPDMYLWQLELPV